MRLSDNMKWVLLLGLLWVIWSCVRSDRAAYKVAAVTRGAATGTTGEVDAGPAQCTGGCGDDGGKGLLPVLNPCFNMREICKQSILLEDHLFQTEKRCTDCIKKHFLCMEGLSEEAITLDKNNQYDLGRWDLPQKIRSLEKRFIAGESAEALAQELRQIRKPLMAQFFDKGL